MGALVEDVVVVVGCRWGSWKVWLWVWSWLCWASWVFVGVVEALVLFV